MTEPSQTIVLAEDKRQQRFAYRFLRRPYTRHDVRTLTAPAGKGSAEQWVRAQYSMAVKEFRGRHAQTVLIVMIDADAAEVSERAHQLDDELSRAGAAARQGDEAIVHLIPKWSIETWILCCNGKNVEESRSYRAEHGVDENVSSAAETFFEWSRPNAQIPDHCVPSLRAGIEEVRRLG